MKSLLDKLSKYKWEIFVFVSLIIILICWLLKDDTPSEETDNNIYFDPNLLNYTNTPKDKRGKRTESICRNIIEKIYRRPFPSIRPNFLKNPKTGRNLELDMYNEELMLAIEYNGQQHQHYSPYFHKSYEDFLDQLERDQFKKEKCMELGITLISIPYTVRREELESYIIKELRKSNKL